MNKTLRRLLTAMLVLSAAQVQHKANAYTNKTFMLPRPVGVNLPMEYPTFNQMYSRKIGDTFGGNWQSTYFYQASNDAEAIARYFLFNNKDTITLQRAGAVPTSAVSTLADLDLGYLIHSNGVIAAVAKSATINLDPEQTIWGVTMNYHQDLSKILRGLYFYANTSIVEVENNLKMAIASSDTFADGEVTPLGPVGTPYTPQVNAILNEYFSGEFQIENVAGALPFTNQQSQLTNAKINGKQRASGFADIDLGLGYKICDREKWGKSIAIALTIPTGNTPNGINVFQPIVGNGKHFAIGGDINCWRRLWGNLSHNLKFNLMAKYRYLFEHTEKRTLGIQNKNWGQYLLLVQAGSAAATPLTPAANILTVPVDVTPGSQFDGVLGLAYNYSGFCLDVGYNFYYRSTEHVKLRNAFADNQYAIAARSFSTAGVVTGPNVSTTTPFTFIAGDAVFTDGGAAGGVAATNPAILKTANLDINAATTPEQITNAVYANLGGVFNAWDSQIMVGLGGKYEWPNHNSALEQWNVHFKLGVGF